MSIAVAVGVQDSGALHPPVDVYITEIAFEQLVDADGPRPVRRDSSEGTYGVRAPHGSVMRSVMVLHSAARDARGLALPPGNALHDGSG